jgi:protein involved in polysaccharide export with SLBB domain
MHYRTAVLVALAFVASAGAVQAQAEQQWAAQTAELSRTELQSLLDRLDEAARSPGYSLPIRQRASAEAEFVRGRLSAGDFRVGDRVYLEVQGDQPLRDTLTVREGPVLAVPQIGDISLKGVLRSELQTYLQTQFTRYIRNVTVHASVLMRLTVQGQVARQGYYTVPAGGSVEDAVMAAGGPTPDADLEGMQIWRGNRVVFEGTDLQHAITAGRTLNQLDLRPGDRIVVPTRHSSIFSMELVRSVLVLVPTVLYLFTSTRG